MDPLEVFKSLKVGAVICIGHPANNNVWFKAEDGWVDARLRPVGDLKDINAYDTIGHGAYQILWEGEGGDWKHYGYG